MSFFFHGHKETPPSKRLRFGASHPTRAVGAIPLASALRRYVPFRWDQGPTSTCFAHAQATLIVATLEAANTPLGFVPSPLTIARFTYCEEQIDPSIPLQDTGADMGDVMTATLRMGVVPMKTPASGRFSDVTPQAIAHRPSLLDDEEGAKRLVLGPEQLQISAADLGLQIADGIAYGLCGTSLGIHSTKAFEAWEAGDAALTAVSDRSPFLDNDGHDVAVLDYRTNMTTAEREFWLLSSWGRGFGDDGGAWVAESWLHARGLEAWRMGVTLAQGPNT